MHSELIVELLYREIFDQNWGKTIKNLKFCYLLGNLRSSGLGVIFIFLFFSRFTPILVKQLYEATLILILNALPPFSLNLIIQIIRKTGSCIRPFISTLNIFCRYRKLVIFCVEKCEKSCRIYNWSGPPRPKISWPTNKPNQLINKFSGRLLR